MLACVWSQAQAQTVIYQQNFEAPALACGQLDGTARTGATRLQDDFGNNFRQLNSADVLCITPPIAGKQNYSDPSGTAGSYTIGFYGSIDTANTEAVGMAFDPDGQPFVNGSLALAHVKLANYTATPTSPTIGSPVSITMAYYRLRAVAGGGEPASTDFSLSSPTALGQPAIVRGLPTSTVLTPIQTEQVTTTNSTGNDYALDWNTHTFSVDTSGFATGDKLVVLFTGLALNEYVAIDNFVVTTSATAPVPLQVSKTFTTDTVQPGQNTQISIDVQGNNVGDTLGLNLRDSVPAPLTLDGIASNSCAGTAMVTGNALELSGGTVPAAGCQVVLNTTWPASDLCSLSSVTNTIVDGSDFSFSSGAATAGIDATASLACNRAVTPPVATPTAVPLGGLWVSLSLGLCLFGLARRYQQR
ncbi:hypothetical protein [Comamonas sp. JUb58]|uniref:hypothetical protein n=1 Tax=Comamonas sp. JUb58 TaxID=2485114 RepID=UPI00105E94CF|nr:hypothetical protein [Comamonas sp. JUb58]